MFGVNFTENSGVQAQGKYNKQPPTAKRTAHRGEAIGTQKGGARLDSYAQGPGASWWVRDVRGSGAWPGGVDWRRGLGAWPLGVAWVKELGAWPGGVE